MNSETFLPYGIAHEDLVVAAISLAAFVSVFAFWYALVERDPLASRVRALETRRQELRAGALAPAPRHLRDQGLHLMRRIVEPLKRMQTRRGRRPGELLAKAGWRSRNALVVFLFLKLALPVALGTAAFAAVYGFGFMDLEPAGRAVAVLAAAFIGAIAPGALVRLRIARRKRELNKALPDALDLLVISAEAGLSMDASFDRVSREIGRSSPAMADEVGLTTIELGFLPDRRNALLNLAKRADLPSVRGVVQTLQQTQKYGTPLAHALRVLAAEFRNERLMRAEEKAARLPVLMAIPLGLFLLPCLIAVIVGPAILHLFNSMAG